MKDPVPDLLKLAGVPSSDNAATAWLKHAIAGAQHSFTAGKARPLLADHNALLADIEKSAKELSKRIERLRRHPATWRAFWRSSVFGPVYLDRIEILEVLTTIEDIDHAANAAKIRRQGRLPATAKQHVTDLAFAFFVRFSRQQVSGTATGAFARFASDKESTPRFRSD